jgi:Flp pilus assembly secretin CpaC
METAASPPRRRWFRFGLSHLFVLTLGIALGFAPLKLWEMNTRGEQRILSHVKAIELSTVQLASLGMQPQQPASGIPLTALDKSFSERLDALREAGRARILAEPVLTTISGRASVFQVGGEIPVPVTTPDGIQTVEYREFGTRVSLLPTLLRNGRVRVEFESKISTAEQVAHDANLPSFRGSQTKIELDLTCGETVVVCANSYENAAGEEVSLLILATVERARSR